MFSFIIFYKNKPKYPRVKTSYEVSSQMAFGSGEEAKIRFSRWPPIGAVLATSDLQVTMILPTKFPVNWPFDSGEAQNRFLELPSWIFNRNDFNYF